MAVPLCCAMQASLNHGCFLKEYDTDCEVFRQRFRQYRYQETARPRDMFNNLWELCSQWLMPSVHSKEEILELLVFEQFLNILPTEIETWVRLNHLGNRERVLALVEELQKELAMPEQQLDHQEMSLEELAPVETSSYMPQNIQLESLEFQVLRSSQKATLPQTSFPEAEPQTLDYDDVFQFPPFVEPGLYMDQENISQQEDLEIMQMQSFLNPAEEQGLQAQASQNDSVCEPQFVDYQDHSLEENPVRSNMIAPERSNMIVPVRSNMIAPVTPRSNEGNSGAEKAHECSHCGKCFGRKVQLKGHLAVHSIKQSYSCPKCRKNFVRKSDFTRHQQRHIDPKPHKCTICYKHFRTRQYLRAHQKVHCAGKLYNCTLCEKSYRHTSSLRRHRKSHTGVKSHVCKTCGKSFVHASALTLHHRTHTDERPFRCDFCYKNFKQKASLVIHSRIHTGEMPYQCKYCSQRFRYRTGAVLHQVSHFPDAFSKKC